MTAPWCVKFEENILLVVDDNVLVVVCYDDLDGTTLLLRDWLRLDAGLNLAINEVLNECSNIIVGELLGLVEWELLVLDGFLDGKGGPLAVFEIEITSVRAKGFGVNGGEADRSLVLLC